MNDQIKLTLNLEKSSVSQLLKQRLKEVKQVLARNSYSMSKYQVSFNQIQFAQKVSCLLKYESKVKLQTTHSQIWLNEHNIKKVKDEYKFVSQAYQQVIDKYVKTYNPFQNQDILYNPRKRYYTANVSDSMSEKDFIDLGDSVYVNPLNSISRVARSGSDCNSESYSLGENSDEYVSSETDTCSANSGEVKYSTFSDIPEGYDYSKELYIVSCHLDE